MGTLDFCGMACTAVSLLSIKTFPSIHQSPTSGQTNQGSLFEPRNTSPPWQKNHMKYFIDLGDRSRLEKRFYHVNSIQTSNKKLFLDGSFLSWDWGRTETVIYP